jgi:predicted metalloprotease
MISATGECAEPDRHDVVPDCYIVPDSFTHGSSAQRVHWFRLGLETGDLRQGDTFKARDL